MTDKISDPASKVELAGDTPATMEFLRAFAPEGPWCLTAINPNKKDLKTVTFRLGAEGEMAAWLAERNGKLNLYFHVNPVTGNLTKKADREQIAAVNYLHVDIDLPKKASIDIEGEQQRILGLLTTRLKSLNVPIPTFVVFSGGGYQAFWKLEEPLPINGDLAKAEDAKLYNKQLEQRFGGDNCHNIDRIMRLPGTVNLPDAKKLSVGRVPALARLVQNNLEAGAVYGIERFEKAAPEAVRLPEQTGVAAIDKSKVQRVTDLNMLDTWNVCGRVKVVIAQGNDPQEPLSGDNSRSAWLWYALCEMARHSVPAEVMFAIITDPDWPISACVLDKGRAAENDALRQIGRALQFADNPKLLELNLRYCTVLYEGSFRVIERIEDPVSGLDRLVRINRNDFVAFWAGHEVEVGKNKDGEPIKTDLAKWWLAHPKRRQYRGVVFAPERDVPGMLNLWTGFAADVTNKPPGSWRLLRRHIWKYTCNKDRNLFRYIIRWMAWKLQNPATPSEVAPITLGVKGAGKSIIWENYARLFGRHAMTVTHQTHLTGNFNEHLVDKVFLFVDEALNPNDKNHDAVLKSMLTGKTRVSEGKGVNAVSVANCLSVAIASNEDKVVVASKVERRYVVTRVDPARASDHAYFGALQAELDDGGLAAMFRDLRALKLGKWKPGHALPDTDALQDQKWASLRSEERLVADILFEGAVPMETRGDNRVVFVRTATLEKMAADRRLGFDPRTFAEKVAPLAGWERHKSNGVMGYVLPPLDESREMWPIKPGKWPETDGAWAQRADPGP